MCVFPFFGNLVGGCDLFYFFFQVWFSELTGGVFCAERCDDLCKKQRCEERTETIMYKGFSFQSVHPLTIIRTRGRSVLGPHQLQAKHTFSAFWLRSSVVSVLISLISGTCYTVANEINCYVWATSMDQASGLLAFQDRGPGFALPPGAARRFTPHEKMTVSLSPRIDLLCPWVPGNLNEKKAFSLFH